MRSLSSFIVLAISLFVTACGEYPMLANKRPTNTGKTLWARVTYYTKHEDHWGNRVACSRTLRAKQGKTCAAHSDFPFWTKVFFPLLCGKIGNGHLVVQDRGTDVERKKAVPGPLRNECYDFDVFVDMSNKEMKRFASKQPAFMPAILE